MNFCFLRSQEFEPQVCQSSTTVRSDVCNLHDIVSDAHHGPEGTYRSPCKELERLPGKDTLTQKRLHCNEAHVIGLHSTANVALEIAKVGYASTSSVHSAFASTKTRNRYHFALDESHDRIATFRSMALTSMVAIVAIISNRT